MTTIEELRKAASCVYLATEEEVAREISLLLEALAKEVEEATRSAKAWEETAARHCRNEVFYHDLIVKIGEPFGFAAKTSDDGSIQQDVLALKVPELVDSLRTQNRELHTALKLLYDETADYIRINHLGDVHHNRSMQAARDALARIKEVEG